MGGLGGRRFLKRWKYGCSSPEKLKMLKHNLASELILHESLRLSVPRARLASQLVDRLITLAKKRSKTARKVIAERCTEKAARKLFWHLSKRYETQTGGYSRVLKLGRRKSDSAKRAVVELRDTLQTILTPQQVVERQERKQVLKSYKYGLGRLGLATALPDWPGLQPERAWLQGMQKVQDTTESQIT